MTLLEILLLIILVLLAVILVLKMTKKSRSQSDGLKFEINNVNTEVIKIELLDMK